MEKNSFKTIIDSVFEFMDIFPKYIDFLIDYFRCFPNNPINIFYWKFIIYDLFRYRDMEFELTILLYIMKIAKIISKILEIIINQ